MSVTGLIDNDRFGEVFGLLDASEQLRAAEVIDRLASSVWELIEVLQGLHPDAGVSGELNGRGVAGRPWSARRREEVRV